MIISWSTVSHIIWKWKQCYSTGNQQSKWLSTLTEERSSNDHSERAAEIHSSVGKKEADSHTSCEAGIHKRTTGMVNSCICMGLIQVRELQSALQRFGSTLLDL